jgi:hypothetical protein
MFPGGFFAKTYFVGSYFPPADEGGFVDIPDEFNYPIYRRLRRA